jgi:Kef-type K+ transport system membrane component KefB
VDVILEVFVIFAAAKAAGELFVRLRQPAIVGELLVGIALGPHALGAFHLDRATGGLAQLGIVVLLFTAGLESRRSDLMAVGRPALLASLAGMVAAGGTGFGVVVAFGHPVDGAALAAVALAASSVGIAARAFGDLGALASRPARVVLGAAVVDDVATLAILPFALGLSGTRSTGGLLAGLAGAVGFLVLVSSLGPRLIRRYAGALDRPRIGRAPFVVSLGLCLGMAALAERVGLAALVGAFLAGMVLAETKERYDLERRFEPLFDFLVPFFFVVAAARLDPARLADAGAPFLVTLVAVTVAAKLLGCAAGAVGLGRRERLAAGAGMVPRGEVTLAIALAGLSSGAIDAPVFAALLAVVLTSSLLGPALVKAFLPAVGGGRRAGEGRRAGREAPPESSGRGDEGPPA